MLWYCNILHTICELFFFHLSLYLIVCKWKLFSSISFWTHSRLCRAGWMWSRETWTDSFRSTRCSCRRMDTGTRPARRNSSPLANYSGLIDLVLAVLFRLYFCFATFTLSIIKLAVRFILIMMWGCMYMYMQAAWVVWSAKGLYTIQTKRGLLPGTGACCCCTPDEHANWGTFWENS